jgi:hypothetical protein
MFSLLESEETVRRQRALKKNRVELKCPVQKPRLPKVFRDFEDVGAEKAR